MIRKRLRNSEILTNFAIIMKQHRTSLKDLADKLGVSIATVSRALRGSHEVSEEMRERVKDLAKKLNYRPNPFAQSLRKEAPRNIGVVVPNLVTHYYAAVLDGIEEYARQNGYSVFSCNSHEDYNLEERAVDNFISMHVEGIRISGKYMIWVSPWYSSHVHACPNCSRR